VGTVEVVVSGTGLVLVVSGTVVVVVSGTVVVVVSGTVVVEFVATVSPPPMFATRTTTKISARTPATIHGNHFFSSSFTVHPPLGR
jgi:hypothetical protein